MNEVQGCGKINYESANYELRIFLVFITPQYFNGFNIICERWDAWEGKNERQGAMP